MQPPLALFPFGELRTLFSRFGKPETIVSEYGTCFTSYEFKQFLKRNGIKQLLSAPYHPSTNGLAERAVQVLKRGLRKMDQGSLKSKIAKVLFSYRITPQSTTGLSPSELLLGRRPRTRLDLMRPNAAERVERQQSKQVQQHNAQARERTLEAGERVFVRNYQQGERWIPGVIEEATGPVSFRVRMSDGRLRRCHQDQVRNRSVDTPLVLPTESPTIPSTESEFPAAPTNEPLEDSNQPEPVQPPEPIEPSKPSTSVKVYPKRNRKIVDRYEPSWS